MKIGNISEMQPLEISNGTILKRVLIGPRDGAPNFVMRLFTLKPNASTEYHTHPWEHEVFVVEGELEVIQKDKKTRVGKGTYIFVEPNEEHQFHNVGSKEASFICVIPKEGGE
ncbi:MAG TPA: cupin domain-containing protein [Fervidobacterium sp.]|nr:cupin domain-containing protein [Fervidobacterium sp.]HOM74201.1 cupin domain-containing protein [Fervidobacterium sp.]HOQ39763.1 cupin domain-containing protein [Fervidobacterium sp.]HPP17897.1 cupin domain-containing protein [Fervidobacterium sp.]HPT54223.1 cupin domain-containing protein [Fervidobacterium sp.]